MKWIVLGVTAGFLAFALTVVVALGLAFWTLFG